jgi:transposase
VFLKRCRRRKNGKSDEYWALVESYRTPRGARHRVVAYLGELSADERKDWGRLATLLDGRAAARAEQMSLLETSADDDAEPVPEVVRVNLKKVRVEQTRDFGDVWLGLMLWRMLELDTLLDAQIEGGREEIPWSLMACILSIARFVEPSSELHIEDTWYRRTALPDLLGVPEDKIERHRLYRTMDALLPLKRNIEMHLKERIGELFTPDLDLILYDVTSTYFEGEAAANEQAKRGYSRDHRPDCKQVCIALVVTKDGFPLGYEVFDGNRTDVTTVEEIVEQMESRYGAASRVWVMDRGMVSEDNMKFLKAGKRRYILGTPKTMLRQFERHLLEEGWTTIRQGLEVKLCPTPDSDEEVFILCRSADRREKEKAMHARFERRIEDGLTKMARGCERRKQDVGAVNRRIGRLLGRNTRAAGMFDVKVTGTRRTGARVTWTKRPEWREWASLSEGCYLLRTNVTDWSPEDLWRAYIQLTEAENAFRIHKTELSIRPIWHQLAHRVQAHILFSFLAYSMWKTLQTWMERAGLGRGARTIIEELARIKATDVVLSTSAGRDVRLCCVTKPDKAQQTLLDHLGVRLPQRLGRPTWVSAPVDVTGNVVKTLNAKGLQSPIGDLFAP